MKIKKLTINGFGKFNKEQQFEFDEKFTIIIGENESGKSTIIKAILAIIFGIKKNEWEKLIPWGKKENEFYGNIIFKLKKNNYEIYREFNTNKVIIKKNSKEIYRGIALPSGRNEEKEHYNKQLRNIIGIANKDAFINSNIILQKSIETDINKEIQHIITGASGANYNSILTEWEKEYFKLTKKSKWDSYKDRNKNREIEELEDILKTLKNDKMEMEENFIKASELEEIIESNEKKLKTIENSIKEKEKIYEKLNEYITLKEKYTALSEQLKNINSELEKIENLELKLKSRKELLNDRIYSDYNKIKEDDINNYKLLQTLLKEKENKENKLNRIKDKKLPSLKNNIILVLNLFMLSFLIALLGFKFHDKIFFLISSIGLFFILIYMLYHTIKRGKLKSIYSVELLNAENELNEVNEKLHLLNQNLEDIKHIIDEPNFLTNYEQYKIIIKEIENLNSQLKILTDVNELKNKKNEITEKLINLDITIKNIEKETPEFIDIKNKNKYLLSLKNEIDNLRNEREKLEKSIFEDKKRIAELSVDKESLPALEYKISEIEEKLNNLKIVKDTYELAITTLRESIEEYQKNHIPRLAKNITEFYKKITNNRYEKIELDNNFIPIIYYNNLKIQYNDIENILSCGSVDQLFFAIRLALIKELNNISFLPIILDDPFVNFDDKRLNVIKSILYTISDSNQIILTTHSPTYKKWNKAKIIYLS